ncbi:hypothetical protein L1049_025831 [Liquidambar formosana]|uniref:Uncharacterized protein n=1 Tax=Liquidambar formosana TaxID=63359 RepID=A0AAP0R6Q1_LIQFO
MVPGTGEGEGEERVRELSKGQRNQYVKEIVATVVILLSMMWHVIIGTRDEVVLHRIESYSFGVLVLMLTDASPILQKHNPAQFSTSQKVLREQKAPIISPPVASPSHFADRFPISCWNLEHPTLIFHSALSFILPESNKSEALITIQSKPLLASRIIEVSARPDVTFSQLQDCIATNTLYPVLQLVGILEHGP